MSKLGIYNGSKIPIHYISENANWAIKFVGENIKKEIDLINPNVIKISNKPYKLVNNIVHFGSQYMWLNWRPHMSIDNQYITSFFHGKPEDGKEVREHIDSFLESITRLKKIITASSLVEERLINWGVPKEMLVKIPLGVDTHFFKLPSKIEKSFIRKSLGIPSSSIVIGSFQKDGSGWKEGLEPKLIKGPDLFVSTLRILAKKGYPVFALLTGPARGFIKKELQNIGVPYYHTYPSNHNDLRSLYHALDLYLITSREEGGPMGLLESIASGTIVVTTNVGMAKDVITDSLTGGLAEDIDAQIIAQKVEKFLNMTEKEKIEIQKRARKMILKFDWKNVAKQHWDKVYKPLIP